MGKHIKKSVMVMISAILLAGIFWLFPKMEVQARTMPKKIEIDIKKITKLKEDFDSDRKKENVEIRVKKMKDNRLELSVYINGKRKGGFKEWFEGTPIMLITDLDFDDSFKELWIGHHWQGKYIIYRVFRVGKDEFFRLKDDYDSKKGTLFPLAIYDDAPIVTEGDGMISYESEAYSPVLGNYLHKVTIGMDERGIRVPDGVMKHETTEEWRKDRPYILSKEMKLYSEFKGEAPTETLKKKTKFYVFEVRYTKSKKDEYGYLVLYNPWIFVKTKDGRSGWMKVPKGNFYKNLEGHRYEWD